MKLQAVYIMAFTPMKLDNNSLISMCRAGSDMLSTKNAAFAAQMGGIGKTTKMSFSNQLYSSTMHSPQTMQNTLGGWMKNEKVPFLPVANDNYFTQTMEDSDGFENHILFYFHLA